ncbi:MAG: class I SAM-dependent methyltransferase [Deltaproteobacteria bacterium]|nr:class I SAM-dependent methyltransferase [Deltaproteobacteria bacterium]
MHSSNTPTETQIQEINRIQRDFFSRLIHVFDPPLPEGVPDRLKRIVAVADIRPRDTVLDVGAGTGILIPLLKMYRPKEIYACDLSQEMLNHLKNLYPDVHIITGDIRDVGLPKDCINVVFMNACYPNIVDKHGSLSNIVRMMRVDGRLVISHPMGKAFIDILKKRSPFPLDDFPGKNDVKRLFGPFGLRMKTFIDEPELYILLLVKEALSG